MNYMFEAGFLGTRAPFFMDFVTLIVAFLPFLIAIAISFAKKRNYRLHGFSQIMLFVVSAIVVGYFEYGVRAGGGYKSFLEGSSVSHNYAFYVLIFHIIVASIGFIIWMYTLYIALKDSKKHTLPGLYSKAHRKTGYQTFMWIVATSVTGIWVYILLFMI